MWIFIKMVCVCTKKKYTWMNSEAENSCFFCYSRFFFWIFGFFVVVGTFDDEDDY